MTTLLGTPRVGATPGVVQSRQKSTAKLECTQAVGQASALGPRLAAATRFLSKKAGARKEVFTEGGARLRAVTLVVEVAPPSTRQWPYRQPSAQEPKAAGSPQGSPMDFKACVAFWSPSTASSSHASARGPPATESVAAASRSSSSSSSYHRHHHHIPPPPLLPPPQPPPPSDL